MHAAIGNMPAKATRRETQRQLEKATRMEPSHAQKSAENRWGIRREVKSAGAILSRLFERVKLRAGFDRSSLRSPALFALPRVHCALTLPRGSLLSLDS